MNPSLLTSLARLRAFFERGGARGRRARWELQTFGRAGGRRSGARKAAATHALGRVGIGNCRRLGPERMGAKEERRWFSITVGFLSVSAGLGPSASQSHVHPLLGLVLLVVACSMCLWAYFMDDSDEELGLKSPFTDNEQ